MGRSNINRKALAGMLFSVTNLKGLYAVKLSMAFMGLEDADASIIGSMTASIKAPNVGLQLKKNKIGKEGAVLLSKKTFENKALASIKLNLSSYSPLFPPYGFFGSNESRFSFCHFILDFSLLKREIARVETQLATKDSMLSLRKLQRPRKCRTSG